MIKRFRFLLQVEWKGIALPLTLFVLLILALLGLSLLVQSNTEYFLAINEQHASEALHHCEAALEWSKRKVLSSTNLTSLLRGTNNTDDSGLVDDHFLNFRTLNSGLTPADLRSDTCPSGVGCERTTSVPVIVDGVRYEAFRIGTDEDADGDWDGRKRALLYVRIDDNYDDHPGSNNPRDDKDKRVIVTVISEYPVYVDAAGSPQATIHGLAKRTLKTSFGPGNSLPAILAFDLDVSGNPVICGACGTMHANGCMKLTGGSQTNVCQDAEATELLPCPGFGSNPSCGGATIGGTCAQEAEIPSPVINPYDPLYVPDPAIFNTSTDTEFSSHTFLQCPGGTSSSKYFALVPGGAGGKGRVYKAYWDSTNNRYTWRMIDELDHADNTMLDNCGRVVSGTAGGVVLGSDPGAGAAVDDGKADEFYGLKMSGTSEILVDCPGVGADKSLSGLSNNDYHKQDYYGYPPPSTTLVSISGSSIRALPYTRNKNSPDSDGVADFDGENLLKEGDPKWDKSADRIYSPLYNAVIFVYGKMYLSGNPGIEMCRAGGACGSVPNEMWRVTFIAVSSIEVSGNMQYAPARQGFDFTLISGRDMKINGNPVGGKVQCGSGLTACTPTIISNNFAGIIATHEQFQLSGTFSFDGFILSENAIQCAEDVKPGDWSFINGDVKIHYDCVHPPNPFGEALKITSWQEVQ